MPDETLVPVDIKQDVIIEEGRNTRHLKAGGSFMVAQHHADAIIGASMGTAGTIVTIARVLHQEGADAAAMPQQPGNVTGSTAAFEAKIAEADKHPLPKADAPKSDPKAPIATAKDTIIPPKA